MADVTESSSSDGSPASIVPSDVTLDKDVDNKTLKQNLYDLKLRIYYMEQKNKYLEDDDGGDIYQKYVDLQTEFEKLKKNLDEKDELLLKAQKVTLYLREEKEKTLYEFQEKEKLYRENIQQLEKEVEEMKLNDPKFGLHSTGVFMSGGDSADSSSSCVSALNKAQHRRISELESQLNQLNMELESVKANNDQLEQTVFNLQRKINLSNKEIIESNRELSALHKERELYVENCSKRDEILDKMEKQKLEMSEKLSKVEQENESLRSALNCNVEQNGTSKNDKGTAVIIQRLLIENKKVNARLRKVKEDLLQFYEQCSACPHCANEKKLKKAPVLNLRSPTAAAAAAAAPTVVASAATTTISEDECEKGGGVSETENDRDCEKYANMSESELKLLLEEKDELVKQLENELKKRTFNLQELVNKELWDKNREIEKLNKMSEKRKKENDLLRKQLIGGGGGGGGGGGDNRVVVGSASCYGYGNAMRQLQPCALRNYNVDEKENISSMSDDVKLLKEHLRGCLEEKKALLDKINSLESKVAVGDEQRRSQSSLVRNLRLECAKRADDLEEAERARKEAFNACALLTNRLEELACFLESLLAHDVAGINANKRRLLQQAIEKSREISKSFSRTYNCGMAATTPSPSSPPTLRLDGSSVDSSVPILPDCSEINLSFSGGDDDYDVVAVHDRHRSHRLGERTPPMVTTAAAAADVVDSDHRSYKVSVVFQRMARSSDFAASAEDSEDLRAVAPVKRSISFVRHLDAGNELVFSSAGVGERANETNVVDEITDDDNLDTTSTRLPPSVPAQERRGRGHGHGHGHATVEMQNSVTASSAIVSLDEAPKMGDFDSESETWSEPDRNVSAARIGLTNSASKVYVKRLARSEQRSNSNSDASSCASALAKKYPDAVDIRQMQKRIQHLESINESLREELECSRLLPSPLQSHDPSAVAAADKKTDMEKLSEKTKLRNLLNKINLENCVDTEKYRDAVEVVRKHLRELCKHLAKTNKLDKFVSLKLKEVCEHFELCELRCSRLHQRLEEAKTRNDVLAELLQETQSKFEQVMIDLRATKLAYNSVILEHEQNIFKYKRCELTNEQLKEKLKSTDELCRTLEKEAAAAAAGAKNARVSGDDDDALEKASKRIAQLESLVATNDTIGQELDLCKRNVQQLGDANERLLRGVEQLDAYKAKIEEYETQLNHYRENCEKLETELFEKESVERLCEEQRAKLADQLRENDTVHRSLELADRELREARRKIERLESRVDQLAAELRDAENARSDGDRQIAMLKDERERNASLLRELKDAAERELAEKADVVVQLRKLVEISGDRTRKFENELQLLRDMLRTCEEEKRDFRAKIALQTDQYENLKKQHEQQMKHLLSQIIAHRTEEESSLAAHRELVLQIEQAQNKKQLWKKSIREWKDKYEELKKEKQDVEGRLLRCDVAGNHVRQLTTDEHDGGGDGGGGCAKSVGKSAVESSAVAVHVDAADANIADFKVHHLENIKYQLENRVKELEMANRELESRLRRLQSSKITPSDFDASSDEEQEQKQEELEVEVQRGDESCRVIRKWCATAKLRSPYDTRSLAAASPSSYFENDATTARMYSSCSLPSSPNHYTRSASPLASSVPNSPTCLKKDCFASAAAVNGCAFGCENYVGGGFGGGDDDDDDDDDDDARHVEVTVTPARKHSSENSATSPDLGIDSDHGRNSSSFEFDSGNGGETKIRCEIINLEEENKSLKRELGQTKKELEETLGKLTTLNKNKKRMEKAIFKQIFETKHILKRARVNLEDASATADTDANAD